MSCQHTSSATGRFGNRTYSYFNPQSYYKKVKCGKL
ncbi:hypothetical protein POY81_13640 [Phocaeicola vulgatus]|nr:hypothetical protein [Phocaeicola vulgatus]MDC1712918.1 hypothetical protein [Phocaeicola vulgatus]MDC1717194.1 hypothetical protein [Phocaeicola vulgatus]